ncbi:MAG: DNA-processing protein DprA [Fidelibacterota bacterium]|nr:MAG: DNA-processing protein DprA [Candidatus Neomarinimicrobiota bacterium]
MLPDEVIITLGEVPGLGSRRVRAILNTFSDVINWNDLLSRDLVSVERVSDTLIERLRAADPDTGQRILEQLPRLSTRYVHYWHEDYPVQLKALYDAPTGLYVRGAGSLEGDFLAVVGTRQPTSYGRDQTRRLCQELVAAGLGIVSGFARGIDTAAHKATLDTGGNTVAVLGCGVDVIYPMENRKIYQELLGKGLTVSEYPPGTSPDAHHFPQRNRIISGLSLGTLVVEAGKGSGALITAYHALDQDREVFALPGRVDSAKSDGCHEIIQRGAKLVTRVEDVLSELTPPYSVRPGQQMEILREVDLTDTEREIMEYLTGEPVLVDRIAEDLKRDVSELLGVLLHLEMKGLVIQSAGKQFARA